MQVGSAGSMQQMQMRNMDGSGNGMGQGQGGMKDIMQSLSQEDRTKLRDQLSSMDQSQRADMISQLKSVDKSSMDSKDYTQTLLDMVGQSQTDEAESSDSSFSVYA